MLNPRSEQLANEAIPESCQTLKGDTTAQLFHRFVACGMSQTQLNFRM
jgi:hypothetical protein